ncbi:hypothetical protein [Nocardia arizonensis]|uniref:hypothetical protein n=1 Tax=Nocardia arizonensis TaxID=1141647 RepID=UPI000A8C0243|nr:hypothetical protein [Nocardia arizonensis]
MIRYHVSGTSALTVTLTTPCNPHPHPILHVTSRLDEGLPLMPTTTHEALTW